MPQDFSGQNLRGRSFTGLDLSGVNFSDADIRGADFSNAVLRGANFSRALAGLQRHWAIGLVTGAWLLSGISGLYSGLTGYFFTIAFDKTKPENASIGVASNIILLVFFIIAITRGLRVVALGFAVAVAVAVDLAIALGFAVSVTVAASFAVSVAATGAIANAVAVAGAKVVGGAVAGAVAVNVAILGAIAFAVAIAKAQFVACAIAVAFALLGAYMGWRAAAFDERYAIIRQFVFALAARGTSFRGADLTDADFTSATLKGSDFRNAIVTRTCWDQAEWHPPLT